jgi:hypothetical protein
MASQKGNLLYDVLRAAKHDYRPDDIVALFRQVDKKRVEALAKLLSAYISVNLPAAIAKRDGLADYRTNPYVLLTTANVMRLEDFATFAGFLFNNKLYMGLETSFGKSIEAAIVGEYPLAASTSAEWESPPEKHTEAAGLAGLNREQKARKRRESVWREIDRSCVVRGQRFLLAIKSGPNCINDTQVQAMTDAITVNHEKWLAQTKETYPRVKTLDIIVGLTYGTDRTTNNKENQILVKLIESGFKEEDRRKRPGVLIHKNGATRVYRRIGQDFWATVGDPVKPESARFVFLEILLGLAKALSTGIKEADIETRINMKVKALASALSLLMFPRKALPDWVASGFSDSELFWFTTALTAFYDQGV